MLEINLNIPWRILPKNRHYRRRKQGGLYLSSEFKAFQNDCLKWFLQWGNQYIPGPVLVDVKVFYKNRAHWADADNIMKTLGDLLQKAGFIENDRLINWGQVERILTPGRVGAEIRIQQMGEKGAISEN